MSDTIILDARAIATLLPMQSTDADRPVLRGIYLHSSGTAVATDGKVLGMYADAHKSAGGILVMFPKSAKAWFKKALNHCASVELDTTTRIVSRHDCADRLPVELDAEVLYPNVKQIIPNGDRAELGEMILDPKLFSRFNDVSKLTFTGESRAVIVTTRDPMFYGLIMPCRMKDAVSVPDATTWLTA